MRSTSKRDKCFRFALQATNCVFCIVIIYTYLAYVGKGGKTNEMSPENFIRSEKLTDENCTRVCDSQACIWHANMLLKYMNTTFDPCDDFRSFLCGGLIAEVGYHEKKSLFSEADERMLTTLKGILDNIEAEPKSASAKMKTVYDSCVNYGSSELQGIQEFKELLNNIGILNWPDLPEDFRFNGVKVSEIFGNLVVLTSADYMPFTHISGNVTQENYVAVDFYQTNFNSSTNLSQELAVSLLEPFDLEERSINMAIEDYKSVRNAVLKLSEDYKGCGNMSCSIIYIDCSSQTDDDWHEFCDAKRFMLNFSDATSTKLIAVEKHKVMFFKELYLLLNSIQNRSLANFVALSLLRRFQPELNFYFRLSKFKHRDFIDKSLIGYYELDRWKYCVRWTADNMLVSLQNEFFRQFLTNSVTEEMTNIYKDYQSDLIDMIIFQEWIPTEIKSSIVEEIKNISFNIDIMRKLFPNDTYTNKVYEKFEPDGESFFKNVVRIKRFKSILQPPEEYKETLPLEEYVSHMTHFDIQASFVPPTLDIHFGMLLPPFYVPGHINVVNRVLLAPIIGHELGHVINEKIAMESGGGIREHYEKRKCIREQFSRFKFEYLNESLQGIRYDTENIPDNIAMTVLEKVIEEHSSSEDVFLPGLPYSIKQILYMSSVQMWCSKSNQKTELYYKDKDHHAPSEFRLLGIMQNSKGPSEAFHCPAGSFMNPTTKCAFLDQ